jgi:FAD/FMN-containing dehydrogenase
MGNNASTPSALQQCLAAVGNGSTDFAGFPTDALYQTVWVKPYNLNIAVNPAAVVRPRTAEEVAGAVRCAAASNVKVQAKSGGHSYG